MSESLSELIGLVDALEGRPASRRRKATTCPSNPRDRRMRTTLVSMLDAGTKAPDFSLPDQDGTSVSLSDFRGHWVLLWWYPKASTRG